MARQQLETVAVLAVGVAVVYLVYKSSKAINNFAKPPPLTPQQFQDSLTRGGVSVKRDSWGQAYYDVPGGVAYVDTTATPNLAQRILIGLDRFIPGDWLTRKVLS